MLFVRHTRIVVPSQSVIVALPLGMFVGSNIQALDSRGGLNIFFRKKKNNFFFVSRPKETLIFPLRRD